jgi:hypothetical protein
MNHSIKLYESFFRRQVAKITILVLTACIPSKNIVAQIKLSSDYVVKIDLATLSKKKLALQAKDTFLVPAYEQLLKSADKLLQYKPVSVMDKTETSPSGSKHDYVSLAPYWWPDSSKKDGLPYIRKDGKTNPEVKNYPDKNNMPQLCTNAYFLSLAYYYSGKEKYAKHASALLRVWFLDTATKMNPNLEFGQIVKGRSNGRGAGIIDSRHFIFVIDAVAMLKNSKSWTAQLNSGLKNWFGEYLNWLGTSKNGIEELEAKNNHGVWYDAQALAMAIFTENKTKATEIVTRAKKRLDVQMNNEGFFPLELERTTSLGYSSFVLNAFFAIGQLSQTINEDFWFTTTTSGKSLTKSFNALLPYISKEKHWFGQQIKPFTYEEAFPLLIRGEQVFGCGSCKAALNGLAANGYLLHRLF